MLEEFAYLGRETAERVVIDEPNRIAEQVGDVRLFIPHPEGKETFQPFWPEAEHDLRRITLEARPRTLRRPAAGDRAKAHRQGAGRHHRLRLLHAVHDRRETGGQVAFRRLHRRLARLGRFVPGGLPLRHHRGQLLPPHYVCPSASSRISTCSSWARPASTCPRAIAPSAARAWTRTASTSPSRSFSASRGNKVPDIDLNFSGVYQPVAHNYIKELFGAGKRLSRRHHRHHRRKDRLRLCAQVHGGARSALLQRRKGAPGARHHRRQAHHRPAPRGHGRAAQGLRNLPVLPPSSTRRTT